MTAYDAAPWHDFCVAFAGASGALLGLAFVAISFNLEAIIADKLLPVARSKPSFSLHTRSPAAFSCSCPACLTWPSA